MLAAPQDYEKRCDPLIISEDSSQQSLPNLLDTNRNNNWAGVPFEQFGAVPAALGLRRTYSNL